MEFQDKCEKSDDSKSGRNKLVTLNWQGNRNTDSSSEVVALPVPYELPPQPYTAQGWSLALLHLISKYCIPMLLMNLPSFHLLTRCSLVMGSAIHQERRLWSSLATASSAVCSSSARFLRSLVHYLSCPRRLSQLNCSIVSYRGRDLQ